MFVIIRGWSVGDCAMRDFGCLLVCLFVCGPGLVGGLNCVVLDFGVDLIVIWIVFLSYLRVGYAVLVIAV